MNEADRLTALEHELVQLKEQLPAHSIPPSTLMRIDELEEAIAELRERIEG